jgi:anti-anti-sigma factor
VADETNTFSVANLRGGERPVVALRGEFDIAAEGDFRAAIEQALEREPRELTVDLRQLGFMDSTGLRSLLALHRRCRALGCRLRLLRGRPTVDRIFTLSMTDAMFEFIDAADAPDSHSQCQSAA